MPKTDTVNMAQGGMYFLGEALKMEGGAAKHITIDLNGAELVTEGTNCMLTKDAEGNWVTYEENGRTYYQYNILTVPENGSLELVNGSYTVSDELSNGWGSTTIMSVKTGASLVLRDVDINSPCTAGIYPDGTASEINISDCNITTANFTVSTNRAESSAVRITINDSKLTATGATAMLINTTSDTHITNSTISGVAHGLVVRAGYVEVKNSTLKATDTEPGIYAYNNFAEGYNFSGWWGTGNTIPAAGLVVGDYANCNGNGVYAYSGEATVELINTKIQNADAVVVPEVLLAASDANKVVTLNYDADSAVGNVRIYGENWSPRSDNVGVTFSHPGTIKVNGTEKNYTAKLSYVLPAGVGTFAAGTEHPVSALDVAYKTVEAYSYTAAVKAQIEEKWGLTFSNAEWATVVMNFSGKSGELSDDDLDTVAGGGCGNSKELKNRPTLHARVRILTGQSCPNCGSKEGKYKPSFPLAGEHIWCDCDMHYSIDNCEIGIGVELSGKMGCKCFAS